MGLCEIREARAKDAKENKEKPCVTYRSLVGTKVGACRQKERARSLAQSVGAAISEHYGTATNDEGATQHHQPSQKNQNQRHRSQGSVVTHEEIRGKLNVTSQV